VPCANVCGDTDLESLVLTSCTERGFSFKNIHEVMTGLTILVLDDAQCTWEHERFWVSIFKPIKHTCRLVCAASYQLEDLVRTIPSTPVCFPAELTISDLSLTESEERRFFELMSDEYKSTIWAQDKHIQTLISHGASQHLGLIKMCFCVLNDVFHKSNPPKSISAVASYLLSPKFFDHPLISRAIPQCGVSSSMGAVLEAVLLNGTVDDKSQDLKLAVKTGIIVKEPQFRFTSTLHKRFYMRAIFPSKTDVDPQVLSAWLKVVIENFSPRNIQQAQIGEYAARRMPKEALFQAEFYRSAMPLLPVDCSLVPEVSQRKDSNGFLLKQGQVLLFMSVQNCL
jgi:hypothetical protein